MLSKGHDRPAKAVYALEGCVVLWNLYSDSHQHRQEQWTTVLKSPSECVFDMPGCGPGLRSGLSGGALNQDACVECEHMHKQQSSREIRDQSVELDHYATNLVPMCCAIPDR